MKSRPRPARRVVDSPPARLSTPPPARVVDSPPARRAFEFRVGRGGARGWRVFRRRRTRVLGGGVVRVPRAEGGGRDVAESGLGRVAGRPRRSSRRPPRGAGAGFTGTRGELDAGVGMGYVVASAEEGRSRALPGGAESGDRVGMGPRDVEAASSRRATPEDAVALAALVSFESEEEPAGDVALRAARRAPHRAETQSRRSPGTPGVDRQERLRRVGPGTTVSTFARARRRRPVLVLVIEQNIEAVYRRRRLRPRSARSEHGHGRRSTGRTALEGSGRPPPGTLHASIALYSSTTFPTRNWRAPPPCPHPRRAPSPTPPSPDPRRSPRPGRSPAPV